MTKGKRDRPKPQSVALYEAELTILRAELERHRAMGSRATISSMVRWLIHSGRPLSEMPPSY